MKAILSIPSHAVSAVVERLEQVRRALPMPTVIKSIAAVNPAFSRVRSLKAIPSVPSDVVSTIERLEQVRRALPAPTVTKSIAAVNAAFSRVSAAVDHSRRAGNVMAEINRVRSLFAAAPDRPLPLA